MMYLSKSKQIAALIEMNKSDHEKIRSLRAENKELREKYDKLREENTALQEENEEFSRANNRLEDKVIQIKADCIIGDKLQRENEVLKAKNEQQAKDSVTIIEALEKSAVLRKETEYERDLYKHREDFLRRANEQLHHENRELKEKLTKYEGKEEKIAENKA